MTATVENSAESGEAARGVGRVARIIGPVVDVEFPADQLPEIYYALHTEVTLGDETRLLTLEVEQHLGDNIVRTISMQPTDGMVRGAEVTNTGAPIEVPVGEVTKGHVFNALGETLDVPTSSLDITVRWPIHRDPPPLDQLEPRTDMFLEMTESGVIADTTLVFGQMDEPPGTRLRVGLSALTMAEYFRDVEKQDVLLFIDNIFRFTQA